MPKTKKTPAKAARARTAPAAEAPQPAAQAAPEPAPAVVEPPGFRTPVGWNPVDRNPRPAGPLTKTATLVRGISFTFSYSTGPVVLRNGKAIPINESEFASLGDQVDRVDFPDPGSGARIERSIRKFIFHDAATGDQIEMPHLPDRECGPYALSAGDRAQRDRLFEGQEHTAR